MGRKRKVSEERLKWAHEECQRGCRQVDIAVRLGIDPRTLRRLFQERGWHLPKPLPSEETLPVK